ncbi:hypothetical protein V499_01058 [Pseudogymnoascus sp. VKM F-103]|nr:hypothetical protein V499_01058 [Pseudogymnoascus sp. VKM F-103]
MASQQNLPDGTQAGVQTFGTREFEILVGFAARLGEELAYRQRIIARLSTNLANHRADLATQGAYIDQDAIDNSIRIIRDEDALLQNLMTRLDTLQMEIYDIYITIGMGVGTIFIEYAGWASQGAE